MNLKSIEESFVSCSTSEQIYQKIISWGKQLPPFKEEWKSEANRVIGCQSVMYLNAELKDDRIFFSAASDALISAGLAAILIEAYNGMSPEAVLKTPPTFLEKLGISASLTPGRANGLASLFLKMKQEALHFLIQK